MTWPNWSVSNIFKFDQTHLESWRRKARISWFSHSVDRFEIKWTESLHHLNFEISQLTSWWPWKTPWIRWCCKARPSTNLRTWAGRNLESSTIDTQLMHEAHPYLELKQWNWLKLLEIWSNNYTIADPAFVLQNKLHCTCNYRTNMLGIMNDVFSACRKHARHAIERVFLWLQAGAEMDPESK